MISRLLFSFVDEMLLETVEMLVSAPLFQSVPNDAAMEEIVKIRPLLHIMFQTSSAAWQNLLHATLADKL